MNLNQVTIPSKDLYTSVEFYKLLGLTLIVDALPRYVRFECPDGESTLSVHHVESLPQGDGVILYFENNNLDVVFDMLKQKGVTFTSEPKDQTWLWREAQLNDPDGNRLILFQAEKNRKNPPWRIN